MKDAIRLRRTQAALRSSSSQNVFHVQDGANVLAFQRWTAAGGDLVIIASLNNSDLEGYQLGFPLPGEWHEVLNGDAAVYGGRNRGNGGLVTASGPPRDGFGQSAAIVIPRMGVLVFAREPVEPGSGPSFLRGDCNGDRQVDLSDAVRALLLLFGGAGPGDCPAACDAGPDGAVNVSDPIQILTFLFRGGPEPGAPWPACGAGAGVLECARACEDA